MRPSTVSFVACCNNIAGMNRCLPDSLLFAVSNPIDVCNQVIQNNLWLESPPAPPSAEEIETENRQEQAAAQEKQRVKVCCI